MQLHSLALRASGAGRPVRFHDRLTVLSDMGTMDRQNLVEVILGLLSGEVTTPCEVGLTYKGTARRISLEQTDDDRFVAVHSDDGSAAPTPALRLACTVHQLFDLMYVSARQLGLAEPAPAEPAELVEARAALAALTDELEGARVARSASEAFRLEVIALDGQIQGLEAGAPRRAYARLLVELEQVKQEKSALLCSAAERLSDEVLADQGVHMRAHALAWREALALLDDARRQFGDRTRLDAGWMHAALAVPDRVPLELEMRSERLAAADEIRANLSDRLAEMMASHLDPPSHPAVARLARADQHRLWEVCRRAVETGQRLERKSLAVSGVAEGLTPSIVEEIESAHTAVEAAQEVVERRKYGVVAATGVAALSAIALPMAPLIAPLALAGAASAAYWAVLAPRHALAEAQTWEDDTLNRAGVPSYLAFHLRRIEALQDPALAAEVEVATAEHRRAMLHWRLLAGEVSPLEALELEGEVRTYADAVNALGGLDDDVRETRHRLTVQAEPAVEAAREALMELCRPFGIENPTLAADLVRQLAAVGALARRQAALEAAEQDDVVRRCTLEDALARLGYDHGDLAARIVLFEDRAAAATQRVLFRSRNRPVEELERKIARLEQSAEADYRAEFGTNVTPDDAHEPNPEVLAERRRLTAIAYGTAAKLVPDVSQIHDRHSAVERRVNMLQDEHGRHSVPTPAKVASVERMLRERLSAVGAVGPAGESLPLLLDDCLVNLRADAKWTMLDLVDRLAGDAQVVYLTEDGEVATWARRRAANGSIVFSDKTKSLVAG